MLAGDLTAGEPLVLRILPTGLQGLFPVIIDGEHVANQWRDIRLPPPPPTAAAK